MFKQTHWIALIYALCMVTVLTTSGLSAGNCAYASSSNSIVMSGVGVLPNISPVPLRPELVRPSLHHTIAQPEMWMPVPTWLAGTWVTSSQIVLYSYKYSAKQAVQNLPQKISVERSSVIGTQRDSSGQIWHFTGSPYVREIESGNYLERHEIRKIWIQESRENYLSVGTIAEVWKYDKELGELIDHFFELTSTRYEPLNEGLIQVTYLIDDYDLQWKPMYSSRSLSVQQKVRPFIAIDRDQRGNLRQMFLEFQQGYKIPTSPAQEKK